MKLKSIIPEQGVKKFLSKQITLTLLVAAFVSALIYGCGIMPGHVYTEWSRTMSQLGIFPVFPPREDVQVGDVWLLPMHPLDRRPVELIGGLGMTGIWCDNILQTPEHGTMTPELIHKVSDFYKNRFSFPSSSESFEPTIGFTARGAEKDSDVLDTRIIPVPTGSNGADIYDTGTVKRLRQVAFPDFAVTSIRQGSLNALVPVEALSVVGGYSFTTVKEVSLKIPSAESYGLPAQFLLDNFLNKGFEKRDNGDLYLRETVPGTDIGVRGLNIPTAKLARSMYNETFDNIIKNMSFIKRNKIEKVLNENATFIWVAIVNEVFYARAIDISITKTDGQGGAVNVQPVTSTLLNELDRLNSIKRGTETTSFIPTTDTEGTVTITPTTTVEKEIDPFELAKQINKYNQTLGQQAVPGGSINIVSVSKDSIGMRRFFDKPIAVGVRGLIMRVNVETLKIEYHGPFTKNSVPCYKKN